MGNAGSRPTTGDFARMDGAGYRNQPFDDGGRQKAFMDNYLKTTSGGFSDSATLRDEMADILDKGGLDSNGLIPTKGPLIMRGPGATWPRPATEPLPFDDFRRREIRWGNLDTELTKSADRYMGILAERESFMATHAGVNNPSVSASMKGHLDMLDTQLLQEHGTRLDLLWQQAENGGGLTADQDKELRVRQAQGMSLALGGLGAAPVLAGAMTSRSPYPKTASTEARGPRAQEASIELAPHLQAERMGFPGVRVTENGGPTFVGTDYLYPVAPGERNVVEITMTGSRLKDFEEANRVANLQSKVADKATAPKGYVWHHVDNFEPLTGATTMELVRRDVHEVIPHAGSVRQWEVYYRSTYKR